MLGCSNAAPTISGKLGVLKTGDCDDADANAFPGQTAYFDVPRTGGSFDYNCDGSQTKQYGTVSGNCDKCGQNVAGNCTTCLLNVAYAGYNCVANCGGPGATVGYKTGTAPNCGIAATLYTCSATGTACGTAESSATVKQPCR
jgi:hypothetical protein